MITLNSSLEPIRVFGLFFVVFVALTACTTSTDIGEKSKPKYLVLPYSAFGPGEEKEALLGPHHWQWPDPENRQPVSYDIKVLVYRNASLTALTEQFPVIPEQKQDYRYLEYSAAVAFLDQRILDMHTDLETPSLNDETTEDRMSTALFLNKLIIDLYRTNLAIERKLHN